MSQCNEQNIPVVVLINSSDPCLQEDIVRIGAKHCLSKPCNHRKLINALTHLDESPRIMQPQLKIEKPKSKLNLSILAVDDNPANLKLISAMLGDAVTHIATCTNGSEAVDQAKKDDYDLIFMDIQMPIMDGITACQHIRESSRNKSTPIIAVTAHAMTGERDRLLSKGMDDYLTKPIDETIMKRMLQQWGNNPHVVQDKAENVVLDWDLALQRSMGKTDLAIDMLAMFINSLPEVEAQLEQALTGAIEHDDFLQIIHKFNGAAACCGVVKIQKLVDEIEGMLRKGAPIVDLEPEIFELQEFLSIVKEEAKAHVK